jgi:hypothetical protein
MTDLSAFIADTAEWKGRGKRVPWAERRKLVALHFPQSWAAASADAHTWLADDSILFRMLEDCLRVGQSDVGRPDRNGPRLPLETDDARDDYLHLAGLQYSEKPFTETFRALIRHRRQSISMATASIKAFDPQHVGLSRSRVYRLMLDGQPTLEEIVLIARAYNKAPEYFTEYRVEAIVAALGAALERVAPETSLHLFRKLTRA